MTVLAAESVRNLAPAACVVEAGVAVAGTAGARVLCVVDGAGVGMYDVVDDLDDVVVVDGDGGVATADDADGDAECGAVETRASEQEEKEESRNKSHWCRC